MASKNYYEVLGVATSAEFPGLRKAYRTRAMECHPDRHGGDAGKAEEFKRLVEAFNVLTDPVKRHAYDLERGVLSGKTGKSSLQFDMGSSPADQGAILDTQADDILEELIVGNSVSAGDTSLATLMLDLARTEQFCLFREAKTHLYNGSTRVGEALFKKYLVGSPANILAHYFLSKCLRANGKWREAERQLVVAIQIGGARRPALQLRRLRRELAELRHKQPGLFGMFRRLFGSEPPKPEALPVEERERRALNRSINRLAMERERSKRYLRGRDSQGE